VERFYEISLIIFGNCFKNLK